MASDRLAQKVVIVTGGGTGIGKGIAWACAQDGAAVVLAQRRIEVAQSAAAALVAGGYKAAAYQCDVSRRDQVRALVEFSVATYGRLDVMVDNAALTGAGYGSRPFMEETQDHWQQVLDINLTGAFLCTQEAARQFITQESGGVVVLISSVAQYAAQEHAAAYCAAKAGLDGLCKTAAIELADQGIRVVNIAPGDINTPASADVRQTAATRGANSNYLRYTPGARRGTAEECGAVVAFVASPEASFVTGCTWLVDGGLLSY